MKPSWEDKPSESDLIAASDYLALFGEYIHRIATVSMERMMTADSVLVGDFFAWEPNSGHVPSVSEARMWKAKDLLRASRLPLLPKTNPNVRKHVDKWKAGEKTRPVILRIRPYEMGPLEIADGYHRVSAAYWVDENSEVRCFVV